MNFNDLTVVDIYEIVSSPKKYYELRRNKYIVPNSLAVNMLNSDIGGYNLAKINNWKIMDTRYIRNVPKMEIVRKINPRDDVFIRIMELAYLNHEVEIFHYCFKRSWRRLEGMRDNKYYTYSGKYEYIHAPVAYKIVKVHHKYNDLWNFNYFMHQDIIQYIVEHGYLNQLLVDYMKSYGTDPYYDIYKLKRLCMNLEHYSKLDFDIPSNRDDDCCTLAMGFVKAGNIQALFKSKMWLSWSSSAQRFPEWTHSS